MMHVLTTAAEQNYSDGTEWTGYTWFVLFFMFIVPAFAACLWVWGILTGRVQRNLNRLIDDWNRSFTAPPRRRK